MLVCLFVRPNFVLLGFISNLTRVLTWASAVGDSGVKSALSSCTRLEIKVFCCPPGVYIGDHRHLSASYRTHLQWCCLNVCRQSWLREQVSGQQGGHCMLLHRYHALNNVKLTSSTLVQIICENLLFYYTTATRAALLICMFSIYIFIKLYFNLSCFRKIFTQCNIITLIVFFAAASKMIWKIN